MQIVVDSFSLKMDSAQHREGWSGSVTDVLGVIKGHNGLLLLVKCLGWAQSCNAPTMQCTETVSSHSQMQNPSDYAVQCLHCSGSGHFFSGDYWGKVARRQSSSFESVSCLKSNLALCILCMYSW